MKLTNLRDSSQIEIIIEGLRIIIIIIKIITIGRG
jgi:hypothetical protein